MLAIYAIVNGNQAGWTSTQTLVLSGSRRCCWSIPRNRGARARATRAAAPLPPAQSRDRKRRRCPLGRGHVRVVLHLRALHATRARLYADADRPRLPARQPDHGCIFARPFGPTGDAVRHQGADRDRHAAGRNRPGAVCARASGGRFHLATCCRVCSCSVSAPAWPSTRFCSRP